ncbi:hypothetical protein WN53_08555 [Serratia fonticola]|nr:hypothetical protein WN53_08555 [Serratia fonticola]
MSCNAHRAEITGQSFGNKCHLANQGTSITPDQAISIYIFRRRFSRLGDKPDSNTVLDINNR